MIVWLFRLLSFSKIVKVAHDELECVGFLGSNVDFLIGCIWLAKQDVLLDVGVEENGLLHDVATLLAQGVHIILVKRLIVNRHLTLLDVVEAQEDAGEGTLAAARVAHESDFGTCWDVDVEVVHDVLGTGRVIESHILELNVASLHLLNRPARACTLSNVEL